MEKKSVAISVIVPVYNLEKWIEKCLYSILEQTFQDFEIIVIDDGSKDNSAAIIRKISEKHKKVRAVFQENNGQAVARNKALEIARGTYIVFVDGDDYIGTTYLEHLYQKIYNENLDCVVCGYQKVDSFGKILGEVKPEISSELYKMKYIAVCSKIFKREFLETYHIRFPEHKLYEDVPFSWKVMHLTDKIGVIQETGYYYLQREGSSSHRKVELEKIPLREYEETLRFILQQKKIYEKDLLEYSVLSFFTYMIFCLSRKSEKKVIKALCEYAKHILDEYFPYYNHNKYLCSRKNNLPIQQKFGILIFVFLIKHKLLKVSAYILTKF